MRIEKICKAENQENHLKLHLLTGQIGEEESNKIDFLLSYKRFTSYKITIDDATQLDILNQIMETVAEKKLEIEVDVITN